MSQLGGSDRGRVPTLATIVQVTSSTQEGHSSTVDACPPPNLLTPLRPPPDIDKPGRHPGPPPVTMFTATCGLHHALGSPPGTYQSSATSHSACAPMPTAPYAHRGGMSPVGAADAFSILTALGQGDRLASTLRSMAPRTDPPYLDLRDPALWQRIRTAEAQAASRAVSVGGAIFRSTTDADIVVDLPTTHAAFAETVLFPSPVRAAPILPLVQGPDGRPVRPHTKRRRKGRTTTAVATTTRTRFAVSLRPEGPNSTTAMVATRVQALSAVISRLYPDSAIPESEVTRLVTTAFDSLSRSCFQRGRRPRVG